MVARSSGALAYVNRRSDTYYLHEGTTRTGKPRLFVAKTVGPGALAAMPAGFEFCESVNAVVSVRRIDLGAPTIPPADVALVASELARHRHLRAHRADAVKGALVVFEPDATLSTDVAMCFGVSPARAALLSRYTPVVKFIPAGAEYDVHRMTYSGHGGWSRAIEQGPLAKLVRKWVPPIGTDKLFDLT